MGFPNTKRFEHQERDVLAWDHSYRAFVNDVQFGGAYSRPDKGDYRAYSYTSLEIRTLNLVYADCASMNEAQRWVEEQYEKVLCARVATALLEVPE